MWKTGPFAQCRRAYLSEPMAPPSLPSATAELRPGTYSVAGRSCRLWINKDGPARQRIYVDAETGLPLSVTDEYWEEGPRRWAAVTTYTFEALLVLSAPPADKESEVGGAFEIAEPWGEHEGCSRHIGGWPSIHAFHHFLRV